jgi:hypothetical protein
VNNAGTGEYKIWENPADNVGPIQKNYSNFRPTGEIKTALLCPSFWASNSELHTCLAGILPLESLFQHLSHQGGSNLLE